MSGAPKIVYMADPDDTGTMKPATKADQDIIVEYTRTAIVEGLVNDILASRDMYGVDKALATYNEAMK